MQKSCYMQISQILKQLLKEKGMDRKTLAEQVKGVHLTQIYRILSGEQINPRMSTVKALADALNIPVARLFREGSMEPEFMNPPRAEARGFQNPCIIRQNRIMRNRLRGPFIPGLESPGVSGRGLKGDEFTPIPKLGRIPAGIPTFSEEEIRGMIVAPYDPILKSRVYALRVKGDSMTQAGINDQDIVICKATESATDGNIIVAWIDNEITLKYFYHYDHEVILQAANPKYPPIVVTEKNQFRVAGVVLFSQKHFG